MISFFLVQKSNDANETSVSVSDASFLRRLFACINVCSISLSGFAA